VVGVRLTGLPVFFFFYNAPALNSGKNVILFSGSSPVLSSVKTKAFLMVGLVELSSSFEYFIGIVE